MRIVVFVLVLFIAAPALACAPDRAVVCLGGAQRALDAALGRVLGATPEPARQAEIMTAQVLWRAYLDLQCGLLDPAREAACQLRQTQWRVQEVEAALN